MKLDLIPIDGELVKGMMLPRPKDCHKGTCGRVLVIAGSTGLTGAAVMASQAALRAGAGIVSLACAESLNTIFLSGMPGMMILTSTPLFAALMKESKRASPSMR